MSRSWIRWGAALLALGFIAAVVVVSSTSESNDGGRPKPGTPAAAAPVTQSEYSNIYVVDLKPRATPKQLTHNQGEQVGESPSWSEQGRIAFAQSECERCPSRLLATAAGGRADARMLGDVGNVYQPAWSPDGRRIAVARSGSGIFVITLRDGSARRLTSGGSDGAPAWSPDGRVILFQRQVTATNWDIYRVRPAGGGLRRLTHDRLQQLHPSWSPDGARIAFAEQEENGNWVIFSMRADGSNRKRLTDEHSSSQDPSWSPDGRKIAFIAQAGERASVSLIDAGGGIPRQLTGSSLAASGPVWSPDGTEIAFAAHELQKGHQHH